MRNTLYNLSTLGAAAVTAAALDIRDAFAAGEVDHAITITNEGVVIEHGEGDHYGDMAHADGAHGKGHYEEIEGLPQLDFTTYTSQIFWMFAGFILLYIFFAKKTLPEISGAVETRREKIEGDLDNAQDLKEQAEKVQSEYEAALQDARQKASDTFKVHEDAIKADSNAHLDAFKDRSAKLTADTEAKLQKAKEAALSDTQSIAAEIAAIAAEKIVGISTDIKQAETMVKSINKKAA